MSERIGFTVVILESLLQTIKEYAEKQKPKRPVSQILEEMGERNLQQPISLAYDAFRRITRYKKKEVFLQEFPMIRTRLFLNKELVSQLKKVYQSMLASSEDVPLNAIVHTLLYSFCCEKGLSIQDRFFDDGYFQQHYTHTRESALDSLRTLSQKLGHSPSIREWRKWKDEIDGPSGLFFEQHFGSFDDAKKVAGLMLNPKGRKKQVPL